MSDPAAKRRLLQFIAVGCVAAAVHWGVAVALVAQAAWHPLVANVLAWLVAFGVSFAGHHHLTFGGHDTPWRTAAVRFLAVSAGGFAVNEAAYALLLIATPLRYDVGLGIVLVGVAFVTYALGRHWAFRRN